MQRAAAVAAEAPLHLWKGTRVSTLLLVEPEALETLLEFDPSLAFLRDKEVRQLVAHRYCLEDVTRRAGRSFDELVQALDSRGAARSATRFL